MTRQAVDKRLRTVADSREGPADYSIPPISSKALRDCAMLTLGWFAALRRSNITALRWSDLTWHPGGDVRVRVQRSKTDQAGEGAWNWLARLEGDPACPVAALEAWLDRLSELLGGDPHVMYPDVPVFPSLNRHGQIKWSARGIRCLRGEAVSEMVQELAAQVGLAGATIVGRGPYGAHSLRAGFVTQACMAKIPLVDIGKVTHHADPRSLAGYNRPVDTSPLDTIHAVVRPC